MITREAAEAAGIGVLTDEAVAEALGVSRHTVLAYRKRRRIPSARGPGQTQRFTEAQARAAGIGVLSDSEVAEVLGTWRTAVVKMRSRWGIPASCPVGSRPAKVWRDLAPLVTAVLARFPGGITARGVARQAHVTVRAVEAVLPRVGVLREGRWYAR